ncbi:MAG: hypothetical protein LBG11_02370 [Bifidobacteriaceae bacterium]|nr:hypothetical protein [Bifidobacteriaceae bacterium]
MPRWVSAVVVASVLAWLGGCAEDPVAAEIAEYDPDEVAALREQADQVGGVDDSFLLSTLRFREQCRVIKAGLAEYAASGNEDAAADSVQPIVDMANESGQAETGVYYQEMIDALRLGDVSALKDWDTNNCDLEL